MMEICYEADKEIVEKVLAKAESGQLKNFVDGKYESYGQIELLAYKESVDEYEPGTSVLRTKPGTAEGPPERIKGVEHIAKPVGTKEANIPRGYILPAELDFIVQVPFKCKRCTLVDHRRATGVRVICLSSRR